MWSMMLNWRSEPVKLSDEKALDCKDAILELKESIAELYQNKFNDVAADYENKLSLLEHITNAYNNGIDDIEERGYLANTKYYEALRNVEKQNIDVRRQELADLTKQMSEAIGSGSIAEGSEAWLISSHITWKQVFQKLFNCWKPLKLMIPQRSHEI